jgi:outer membrane lipopolysaccharide assembly protein LptE/RlpB
VGSATVLVTLVILVVGGCVGWHVRHAYGANSDLKVHKARIPNFRKTRNRSGLISILLVLAVLVLLRMLVK